MLRALAAGAAGFLLKDTPPARLIAAIHAVAVEIGRGRSHAEIATALFMSVATVKANVTRIVGEDRLRRPGRPGDGGPRRGSALTATGPHRRLRYGPAGRLVVSCG